MFAAPVFTSPNTASVNEGVAAGTVIYTATATDTAGGLDYSLSGPDAASFMINGLTGAVSINVVPSYEVKSSYSFTVTATDATNLSANLAVTLSVVDLPPVFESGTAVSVNEGVSTATVVYTAQAVEPGGGSLTYSLSGADASYFTINGSTGAMTFNAVPSYEVKSSYSFTVMARETTGVFTSQSVTVTVNDVPPVFTSGTSASVNEGVPAGTIVITAQAVEPGGGSLTYSLSGADASHFTINSISGAIAFNSVPNYETQSTYNITIRATETTSVSASQSVTINVQQLPPTFSSGTSGSVNESAAAGTTVYTAVASESDGGGVTYSISGTDASSFTINSATGVLTINSVPHYEIKSSYNLTVKAAGASGVFSTQAVTIRVNPVIAQTPSVLTALSRATNGAVSFSFTNIAGASFGALASTNLSLPLSNWTVLGAIIDNPPGNYQFTDSNTGSFPCRFYSVRSP